MGVAAYQRGSATIAMSIQRDFENSASARKDLADQMSRAQVLVLKLEQFCVDAQALFVDVCNPDMAKGLLRSNMHVEWLKKRNTKKFIKLMGECTQAHAAWVESDVVQVFNHLAVCRRKAKAWLDVLNVLNKPPSFRYSFDVPQI